MRLRIRRRRRFLPEKWDKVNSRSERREWAVDIATFDHQENFLFEKFPEIKDDSTISALRISIIGWRKLKIRRWESMNLLQDTYLKTRRAKRWRRKIKRILTSKERARQSKREWERVHVCSRAVFRLCLFRFIFSLSYSSIPILSHNLQLHLMYTHAGLSRSFP